MTDNKEQVTAINLRPDGRAPNEYRPPSFKLNVMKNADGSCLYEQGNAKVLCSVFGPTQRLRMRKLDDAALIRCHLYRSRFANNDRQKRKARADKETHMLLEQVLSEVILFKNYPRTRIDIVFRILQSDGNNVAVCLNAANFALIDAGINMRGILTVVNCSYANEAVIVDVCDQDDPESNGSVSIGSISGKQEASFIDVKGCFARDNFKEIMTIALSTCERIHGQFVNMIAEEVKGMYKDKDSIIPDDLGLDKLRIYEAGEEQSIVCFNISEYDQAFEQIISSSESEEEDA